MTPSEMPDPFDAFKAATPETTREIAEEVCSTLMHRAAALTSALRSVQGAPGHADIEQQINLALARLNASVVRALYITLSPDPYAALCEG